MINALYVASPTPDVPNPNLLPAINDYRPVQVVILQLCLEAEGRPDVIIDLQKPGAVESLTEKPFTIKEGAQYSMKVKFRVQHEVISGLRYLQRVKRKGVQVDKSEEMMGSFAPNTLTNPVYEKKCKHLCSLTTTGH